ncbi:hypothetical protein [Georgenia sp. Z1491]|uniref:hypothetical protein n=1 Tax=Georgenia sp. Z1491 TaxID=3416707 RepID=UPI003CEC0937
MTALVTPSARDTARAAVLESLRPWPTTLAAVLCDSTREIEFRARTVPAGAGCGIVSTYLHRDPRRLTRTPRTSDGIGAHDPARRDTTREVAGHV